LTTSDRTSSTPFIASLVDVLGIVVFVHVAKIVMASVLAGAAHPLSP
jgi:magnesium transporter